MIVSQAPAGGTQTNQYASQTQQQANAANAFMNQWEKDNPPAIENQRDYMMNDNAGYNDYQSRRAAAYSAWAASQPQQQTGAGMGIIASQQQPQQATLSPGGVNTVSQHQTQGYPPTNGNTGIISAAQGGSPVPAGQSANPSVQTMQASAQPASGSQPPAATAPANSGSSGGIISQNIGNMTNADGQITGVQGYDAAQLGDPTKWDITSEQTMQGQLQGLMAHDNPLMQMARARSLEQMNDRGLGNSSLAVGAGEAAAYNAMMPIAQNDSNTYAKAAGYNADESNQFAVQNAGFKNDALKFGADAANVASRTNASNQTSVNIGREQNASQEKIATGHDNTTRWTAQLDANTRMDLGKMDSDTRRYIADQDVGVRRELGYLDADVRREGYQVQREGFDVQRELGYLDANTRTNIANMDNSTQLSIAQMGNEYKSQLQSQAASSDIFRNMSAQIAAIDQSGLDTQSKKNAIERQMMLSRDALNVMGDVGNVDNLAYYYNGGYV